ncbi:aldo/keto reductase [Mariniblastus fucicola]|uniref:2,5-diketo-D-gluconic acid reductase A n=1 Tax=Mariniblastus fucicola TaxID=980251 RepID=A0A5B9P851_9BACT|nr:aldo/keto reductase [Mariniblastus fucicola]QEG22867.1 2,5-diketo-D-gluconic acid reductase A [Mariniblastus fucicola]
MKSFSLHNGDQIPAIGLGTWKMEDGAAKDAVSTALEVGYRHIDCAAIYMNEADVGNAFVQAFDNGLSREDVFITSKLWNDSHKPEHVRPALEESLKLLQLDYLDLYLIHWPVAIKHGTWLPQSGEDFIPIDEIPIIETWQAMEECVSAGLIKHIGVSNFNIRRLEELLDKGSIQPSTNQVECHPFLPQNELFGFCNSNKIQLVAYSPLGSGDRPERMRGESDPNLFEVPQIADIAKKHDKSIGQILLSWAATRGTVAIPKSTNRQRLNDNLAAAEFELPVEDLETIDDIGIAHRYVHGKFFELAGSPYRADDIWS